MTLRIAMWSGPRNISTTMMRSFGARADCAVSDEPFYGAFLQETGADHPMAAEVIAAMDCDWARVAETLRGPAPGGKTVWYQKHMPHHMEGPISIRDFPGHAHAFLIREPERVIASYGVKRGEARFEDLGYARLLEYFEWASGEGLDPPVIDTTSFLADPAAKLGVLCDRLGIARDPAMLAWSAGIHPEDGIWASHWYDQVARSTGFGPPPGPPPRLDGAAAELAAQCRPYYEAMLPHAL
ncbi:MAG: HAD family hydrolase [Novosphingobium sp.]